ncbi:tripartite tricarboxylate transporter TctB family protein [Phreatobacter oligotrophus]|uniref:Tripartite tricarboxylate transporter TctB family protein n=1 Tax=Phreatobacter oligotrophus TaxID=1122261 RepID=A0A2T4YYB3_9HYPH|nr:tripartite tricarboxylate transporter TctB family protein [Phreatobacter oligotrophus]PTM51492.1 tripartite tricarboxylate transporter TctB family protein [Phreatobacter oligotrophus]
MVVVKSPKEFYAGAIYLAFGVAGLWFGWNYPMGTAGRMGAGYFPKVLSAALILLGLVALVRGIRINGAPLDPIRLKPFLLIAAACSLFGLMIEPIGMIGGLFVLILLSAMASREFRWSPVALLGAAGLVAACALVFVWGLSVQMPLVGSWFTGG